MVDLMMWLVIAAMLLAAAIQSINYYQQAAYAYQAKNDLSGTHQWSAAHVSLNGSVPTSAGLSESLSNGDLKLSAGDSVIFASSASKYCVGIKSGNIKDANNVFYSTSDAPNDVKRDTQMPVGCGTPSSPIGSDGTPSSGSTTPPSSGSTTPPSGGTTTPPSGGTTTPPSSGSTTPPSGGSTTPALANGTTVIGWASHDFTSLASEESAFGVSNGMLSTYSDFVGSPGFPSDYASAAAQRQAPLLIAWEPYDWSNSSLNQTEFRPAAIASGTKDTQITNWLKAAQGFTKDTTIMVRFAPEMNDAVRPWSVGVNGGNTAADYIAMWRHVYDIKKSVAPDVVMVWNPLVAGSDGAGNAVSITSVYPGNAYVDMLALDGFNWGPLHVPAGTCGWQSYSDVFGAPIAEIKSLANGKPWGIAEVASASQPESDFQSGGVCASGWGWVYPYPDGEGGIYKTPQDWITQAGWDKTMMELAHRDGALFVNLFNVNKETDWRLNSTPEGTGVMSYINGTGGYGFGGAGTSTYVKSTVK